MTVSRRLLLGALPIVAVALALRLHGLGSEELWLDEAFTYHDINAPGWLGALGARHVPPLYPALVRSWTALAGTGEAALRLPSTLCSTLFVVATMWAARELFEPRIALWSGLWAALSPIQVYYAQETRPYALLTLLLAVTYALVASALRTNAWRRWLLVSAGATAVLYTHYLGALGLASTAFLLLLSPSRDRAPRYVAAMGLGVLLFVPWLVWSFVLTSHDLGGVDWVRDVWESTPPLLAVPRSLEALMLGSERGLLAINMKQLGALDFPPPLRLLGLAMLVLLALCTALPIGVRSLGVAQLGRRAAVLWMALLFPLLVMWGVSWIKPIYVPGRYDQLAAPPAALLLGLAFGRLSAARRLGPALAAAAAIALAVPVGAKLLAFHRQPEVNRASSRATAAALARRLRAADLVVFTGYRSYGVLYQLDQLGYRVGDDRPDPAADARHFSCSYFDRTVGVPAWSPCGPRPGGVDGIRVELARQLAGAEGPAGAVHVVLERFSTAGGNVSMPEKDAVLFREIARLGFTPVSFDAGLGLVELRQPPAAQR